MTCKSAPSTFSRFWIFTFLLASHSLFASQNEALLHRFHLSDGAGPQASLVADSQQNLYGTTFAGGGGSCLYGKFFSGCGGVFELTRMPGGGWSEQVLYAFQGGNDGAFPTSSLVFDGVGNLYGTTSAGGGIGSCAGTFNSGCGTVFELSPPTTQGGQWTEAVLYRFTDQGDGGSPRGSLIFDSRGNLYGTTHEGGLGYGAVFELTPPTNPGGPWTQVTLHQFDPFQSSDGAFPVAGLTFDNVGNLYGTAAAGGISVDCCGTVFQLKPPGSGGAKWREIVAYTFKGGNDGQLPLGDLILIRARIYLTHQDISGRLGSWQAQTNLKHSSRQSSILPIPTIA